MSLHRPIAFSAITIVTATLFAGCSNQPSHFANPLFSADRVPPPSTRTMAPGSALPYYSGDPLPAMPSGQTSVAPAPASPPSQPNSLNWTTPDTADPAVVPAASTVQPIPTSFPSN